MNKSRQDAWTEEEDAQLAEIVLTYIREGKTQLEAFNHASEMLSRTPAACGFRWNATVRKKYLEEINMAKKNKIQSIETPALIHVEQQTLESAISMLEKMKENVKQHQQNTTFQDQQTTITQLQQENERLKLTMERYKEAWSEMKSLWEWIENGNDELKY